jgi:uncharacterized protein YqeY
MINKIKEDLKNAMKEKDDVKKVVLRLAVSSINNYMKDNKLETLSNEQTAVLLQKEVKQLNESLSYAVKAERQDLIDEANAKINILSSYLPKQLSEDEVRVIISGVLDELNIELITMADKGKIMKVLMPKVKGKVDGKIVDTILTNIIK